MADRGRVWSESETTFLECWSEREIQRQLQQQLFLTQTDRRCIVLSMILFATVADIISRKPSSSQWHAQKHELSVITIHRAHMRTALKKMQNGSTSNIVFDIHKGEYIAVAY